MFSFLGIGEREKVKCAGGRVVFVYRDLDKAFPLVVMGTDTKAGGKAKATEYVDGNIEGHHKKKIEALLIELNQQNSSLMADFRTTYAVYASDPCNNAEFLKRNIENIRAKRDHLEALRLQLATLIDLAKNKPEKSDQIEAHIERLVSKILFDRDVASTVKELAEAETTAERMIAGEAE